MPQLSPSPTVPNARKRRRGGVIAAVVVAALVIAGGVIAAILATGGGTPTPTRTAGQQVPAPFESRDLYDFARAYFRPSQCVANPPASEAKLATVFPDRELVRCISTDYAASFWRKDTRHELAQDRRLFLSDAQPATMQKVTGSPAGNGSVITFQAAYYHRLIQGEHPARVYWESSTTLCAAELQARVGQSLATTIAFWHNGLPTQ